MTQKTAMQELKDRLVQMRNEAHINCLEEYKNAMNAAIVSVESLLEKEKQQIIDAIKRGIEIPMNLYNEKQKQQDAIDYYNQTYNQ